MNLRGKLLLPLILFLVCSISGLGYIISDQASEALKQVIVSSSGKQTHTLFRSLDTILLDAEQNLASFALNPALQSFALHKENNDEANTMLRGYAKHLSLFHSVGFISKDGYLVASSSPTPPDGTLFVANQEHYKQALAGTAGISDIYKSLTPNPNGFFPPVVTITIPFKIHGEIQGALFAAVDIIEFYKAFIKPMEEGDPIRMILLNGQGDVMLHPDLSVLFSSNAPEVAAIKSATDGTPFFYEIEGAKMMGNKQTHANGKWTLAAIGNTEQLFAPISVLNSTIFLISILVIVTVATLTFAILNRLITRIAATMLFAQEVSVGNFAAKLSDKPQDEIGKLSTALLKMVDSLKIMIQQAEEQSETAHEQAKVVQKAMDEAAIAREKADLARKEGVQEAIEELRDVVDEIVLASASLADNFSSVLHSMEEQKVHARNTAIAMLKMDASVVEIGNNTASAAEDTQTTRLQAESGAGTVDKVSVSVKKVRDKMDELKSGMALLGERAMAIGEIITVISNIADQTNLLALNAAIEAARAGDAGRGFAVVANEVRKLAESTMTATREVSEAVQGIQHGVSINIIAMDHAADAVANSTLLADDAGDVLDKIVGLVDQSASKVSFIAEAGKEQATVSSQVTQATGEMDALAENVAATMHGATKHVEAMRHAAEQLRDIMEDLAAS